MTKRQVKSELREAEAERIREVIHLLMLSLEKCQRHLAQLEGKEVAEH